jgi:hypothetical protein
MNSKDQSPAPVRTEIAPPRFVMLVIRLFGQPAAFFCKLAVLG